MATGIEMLLNSIFKIAKIDPEQLKGKAVEVQQTVLEIATLLRAIYRQNAVIMTHLGIEDHGTEVSGRSLEIVTGSRPEHSPGGEAASLAGSGPRSDQY